MRPTSLRSSTRSETPGAGAPAAVLCAVATGLRLRGAGGRLSATLVPGGIDQLGGRSEVIVGRLGGPPGQRLQIESVQTYGRRLAIKFRGIDDPNAAEALVGLDLLLPEDGLAALPEGSFYVHELVGMQVRTLDGRELGTVRRVDDTGAAAPLLAVAPRPDAPEAEELLVPAARSICVAIDRDTRTITVDPPEGLLENA
jgi:16S rRNA processing protein RimM